MSDQPLFSLPNFPTQFRAIGRLRGVYTPNPEQKLIGTLTLDDGIVLKAKCEGGVLARLAAKSRPLEQSYTWTVYPETKKTGEISFVKIVKGVKEDSTSGDWFSIRGIVLLQIPDEEKVVVRIEKNELPPPGKENDKYWKPLFITLKGKLEKLVGGQFWDFEVKRQGAELLIQNAVEIENKNKEAASGTQDPISPPGAENFSVIELAQEIPPLEPKIQGFEHKSQESSSRTNESSSQELTHSTPSDTKSEAATKEGFSVLQGKMEITIKINSFPTNVQTIENGWKQFLVDCSGTVVSISVKPKVFKKLSEAQEQYPLWVAAIRGNMGQSTDKGFFLTESSIQIFEQKAKESPT
jgi:hypothetical protein